MGMDEGWLSLVRRSRSAPVTDGFKILSLIGGPVGATIIVCVLGAGLLAVARWRTVIYLGLAEALGSTCSDLIKHYVYRHRPPHPLVVADIGSFPSGHVITTVGVGIALTVIFARAGPAPLGPGRRGGRRPADDLLPDLPGGALAERHAGKPARGDRGRPGAVVGIRATPGARPGPAGPAAVLAPAARFRLTPVSRYRSARPGRCPRRGVRLNRRLASWPRLARVYPRVDDGPLQV